MTIHIMFDVDGVLIEGWNDDPALRRPWHQNLEADLGVDPAVFEPAFFMPQASADKSLMFDCITGKSSLKSALAPVLRDCNYQGDIEVFINYWYEHDAVINHAVLSIVRRLKQLPGVALHIATNQEHGRADYLWQNLGFNKYFDNIFYSAKIGYSKHSPVYYAAVNQAIALKPDEPAPLIFDDTKAVIDASLAAGWQAAQFQSLEDLSEHDLILSLLKQSDGLGG